MPMKPTFPHLANLVSPISKTAFAALAITALLFAAAFTDATAQAFPPPTEPKVRGQVVDQNDKPIPGVAILVKNETTGTASDLNGFFELDLKKFVGKNVTLVFSYIDIPNKELVIEMEKLPKDYGQIKLAKE